MAFGSAIAFPPIDIVPATVTSSSKGLVDSNNYAQLSERLFLGPMSFAAAERNIKLKNSDSKRHWWLGRQDVRSSDNDRDDDVPERHAFLYFLRRGGIKEDWESQESLRRR